MGGDSAALWWLATRWLRRRWVACVPVVVVVVLGTTGTVVALGAAQRTSTAYRDYLERSDVGDVVVNPSVSTREIEDVIRTLPGVAMVRSAALLFATSDEGEPRTRGEIEDAFLDFALVYGSADGLYIEQDRPAVQSGRLPTGPGEAVLNVAAAAQSGVGIGDVVPLAFWQSVADWVGPEEFDELMAEVVEPIGVEHVEIVGIVVLADEVLPDDLYPAPKMIVSADVAARYDCIPPVPRAGTSRAEIVELLQPADCAVSYRYYTLGIDGGAGDVAPTLDEFLDRAVPLNIELMGVQSAAGIDPEDAMQYFLVVNETEQEVDRVERAMRPMVTALVVLGLAIAALTVVVTGLLIAREVRRAQPDQRPWHQLGVGWTTRAIVVATPPLIATVVAVALGIAAGWLLDRGPVGLVGVVEPHPERRLADVAGLAAVGIAFAVIAVAIATASVAARRPDPTPSRSGGRAARIAGLVASPAIADGLRAAYGRRSAVPVIAACAALTATCASTVLFGASLSALVDTPRSYGWPWDVAAVTGGGYGDLDVEGAQNLLDDNPDVDSWSALGFLNEVTLNGTPMVSMVAFDRESDLDLTLLSGALPTGHDEIALGAATASQFGLDIGDTAMLGGPIEPETVTVTGFVVFPTLGPMLSDRVGTGTGMLFSHAFLENVTFRFDPGDTASLATFVGVDLRDGADTPVGRQRLLEGLVGLDLLAPEALPVPGPIRPPEIIDARSTLTVPLLIGIVFGGLAGLGLAFASWASVRSRRRELAVLRTLGFDSSQVRRSVRVQSLATMLAAVAIGVPVGVIAGRSLWRGFATQLGVVPDPASPWLPSLVVVAAGFVLAVVAAVVPAHVAARSNPAAGLRSE